MAIVKPYSGLSSDRLTELINSDNRSALVEGVDFTYGNPIGYSGPANRNTQVTITPVSGAKYKGPKDLHYRRLELSVLDNLPPGSVAKVEIPSLPFSIHGILNEINIALGLNLTVDEVHDATFDEKLPEYPLRINEDISLAWLDVDYQFKVHHIGDNIPLEDVIVFNVLDGLEFVQNP